MCTRIMSAVLMLGATVYAEGEVVVELVPAESGPYYGGESVTVDVWLHSQVALDAYIWAVRLDFSESDPALSLDATFTFDLSSSSAPEDFEAQSELPIPSTANLLEYSCPPCRLQLPVGGSIHIGSLGATLPSDVSTYRLDAMNAGDPDAGHGAQFIVWGSDTWRAFTGEITGGTFDFVIEPPPIPAASQWGVVACAMLLLALGTGFIRRSQSARVT